MRAEPLRRLGLALLAGALLGLSATTAQADTVDTTVTTLLTGRVDPRDGQLHTILPVYESIGALATLRVPHSDGMRIVFSGWGGMILDIPRDQTWTGDIDVGYLEGAFLKERLQIRLGRHIISGGAARVSPIDGASFVLRPFRGAAQGLGVSAYGGLPVTPRFAASRGEATFGGRLFYRFSPESEVGVSFNQIQAEGRLARQDVAIDARLAPHRSLALTGYALLSLREHRLAEADVAATWQPRDSVQIGLDYRRTAPDLFLPLNSIFAVFSQETRDELGGNFYVRMPATLRVYGDYHAVRNEEGWGHRGGAKVSLTLGRRNHTTLNTEVRVLKLPQNGYLQGRLYSLHQLSPALMGTLGLDVYALDRRINGQAASLTGTGTVGYDLRGGFRVVASAMADMTPFVERRVEFVFKLAYNATRRFREVTP